MSLVNAWTGGQYSLYRMIFGAYLFIHFSSLIAWGPELFSNAGMLGDASFSPLYPLFPNLLFIADSPVVVTGFIALGAVAALFFCVGAHDRLAAVFLWYLLACLFGRNPLIANPSLPFVGWLLLAHTLLPASPYGSWSARGRSDPGAGWSMPPAIFGAAWIIMAVGYSYSGYTKLISPSWVDGTALSRVLANPLARPSMLRDLLLLSPPVLLTLGTWGGLALELLFAPLALLRSLRPWLWSAMLTMHLCLMTLIDFADLSFGMVVIHLFTFDPRWIPAAEAASGPPPKVLYDGGCGLCHRAVRFLLAEDARAVFRFAPLESEEALQNPSAGHRTTAPESILLRLPDGTLLDRSSAVVEIGMMLGGVWTLLAWLLSLVPRRLRDSAYDGVARIRHRLFARPQSVCPILPSRLRSRFDV